MKKTYIDVPIPKTINRFQWYTRLLKGAFLSPYYCSLAYASGTPGLRFRHDCVYLGIRLIERRKDRVSLLPAYELIFSPMDSTRYFEFDFASKCVLNIPVKNYLDVSSPRLFPLVFLLKRREVTGTLINPDDKDLAITTALSHDLGLDDRCTLDNYLIQDAPYPTGSFDLITCISVLEHIPNEIPSLLHIWSLLKTGGHFILTVPCRAEMEEQYISNNEYGILKPGQNGYTFWQRFYDETLLQDNILKNIGQPICSAIYGEKEDGIFAANAALKRAFGPRYPFWKEPYLMGRDYCLYDSINELPGEGVIAMEFKKQ